MNKFPEHLGFEAINDLVDGRLDARDAGRALSHLAECAACSAERDALQSVLAASVNLPKSVLPPTDIWPELKKSLDSRKTVVLPGSSTRSSGSRSGNDRASSWRSGALLAAAAVILVVFSSGITAIVLRNRQSVTQNEPSSFGRPPITVPSAPGVLPVNFRQTETEYTRTIDELKLAVDTQRSRLSPETIRTVDHSLAVVDSAIAEARTALLADPNNRMLVDLLSASYQRKLDLLRRTSELGSRI